MYMYVVRYISLLQGTLFASIGHFTAKRKSPYFVRLPALWDLFSFMELFSRVACSVNLPAFFMSGMLCGAFSVNIHVLYINAYYKNAIWKQVSTDERINQLKSIFGTCM